MKQVRTKYFSVASCTYQELLEEFIVWLKDGKSHYACFCDAHGLANCLYDRSLVKAYDSSDAVLADGSVTKALAWIYGGNLPERIIGPYLFPKAMEYGVQRGWKHFFYGAGPGTADLLAEKMREQYPGIEIVGTYCPPFGEHSSEEEQMITSIIDSTKPDFLWVALGCPKQEKWVHAHQGKLNVPIMLPVGAVFDFYSGRIPHAPDWVHPLGLRWLWRLLTGGKRTFKRNMWCVPRAAWLLVVEFMKVKVLKRQISN